MSKIDELQSQSYQNPAPPKTGASAKVPGVEAESAGTPNELTLEQLSADQARKKNKELTAENKRLTQVAEEQRSQMAELQIKVDGAAALVNERNRLDDQIRSLQARISELENQTQEADRLREVTAQAVAARNAAGEAISRLENDNRNLAQQLETSKGLANEALEHAKKLVAENKELRQRASASSQPTPTIGQLVSALGRIETSEKSSPVLARFAKLLREEGEKLAKIEDSRVKKDGPLELTMSDLQSLFDPLRPITILDVPPAEVARYLHLLNLFEDLRRGLLDYLGTQGFRPIRPIPNIDRFDAALHEEIPNLRRPTADKKLVDIIANRATTGVQVMNDDGTYSAALKAQVGRFVFTEASGPTTAH